MTLFLIINIFVAGFPICGWNNIILGGRLSFFKPLPILGYIFDLVKNIFILCFHKAQLVKVINIYNSFYFTWTTIISVENRCQNRECHWGILKKIVKNLEVLKRASMVQVATLIWFKKKGMQVVIMIYSQNQIVGKV